MIAHLKQWWFMHSTWVIAGAHFLIPSVNVWIDKHPHTMEAAIATAVVARLMQGQSALAPVK